MDTATGIIPEDLFHADRKGQVIAYLAGLVLPGKSKARIVKDWARWTGAMLTPAELRQVEASGFERAPEIKLPGE